MAGQEKEIGLADLENFLKQQFPNDNKVNILLEQVVKSKTEMEKEMGEANPFFYAEFYRQILASGDMNLNKWVDSKGNVNVEKISTVVKIAKKEFEQEKIIQEQQKIQQEQVKLTEEEIIAQFDKIDFDNIKSNDWLFISEHISDFLDNTSYENIEKFLDNAKEITGSTEELIQALKVGSKLYKNQELSPEDKEFLKNMSNEFAENLGYSKQSESLEDKEKFESAYRTYVKTIALLTTLKENNELNQESMQEVISLPDIKEFIDRFPDAIDTEKILLGDIKLDEIKEQIDITNEVVKDSNLQEQDKHNLNERVEDAETIQTFLEDSFNEMFASMDDPALNFEEFELDNELEQSVILDGEEQLPNDLEQEQKQTVEEMPVQDSLEQEEYEAPTFEEEKTGIAKFFETVKNLRPVQAIRKVFAPREEQKKLNAPTNQRTENGVRYTEYEQNGSLLPANIRARNFLRDISVKAVEAVTNGIKNLTERNKQEDVILNKPEIIKSQEKDITKEEQQKVEPQNVIESMKTNEMANRSMNEFDAKYSIHSETSEFHMTEEEIAKARQAVLNSTSKVHNEGELAQEEELLEQDDGTR